MTNQEERRLVNLRADYAKSDLSYRGYPIELRDDGEFWRYNQDDLALVDPVLDELLDQIDEELGEDDELLDQIDEELDEEGFFPVNFENDTLLGRR